MSLGLFIIVVLVILALALWALSLVPIPLPAATIIQFLAVIAAILVICAHAGVF